MFVCRWFVGSVGVWCLEGRSCKVTSTLRSRFGCSCGVPISWVSERHVERDGFRVSDCRDVEDVLWRESWEASVSCASGAARTEMCHRLSSCTSTSCELMAPAPLVCASLEPVVEHISAAPVVYTAPAPVVEYFSPAPAVNYVAAAPVVYAAPAPVVEYIAATPAVDTRLRVWLALLRDGCNALSDDALMRMAKGAGVYRAHSTHHRLSAVPTPNSPEIVESQSRVALASSRRPRSTFQYTVDRWVLLGIPLSLSIVDGICGTTGVFILVNGVRTPMRIWSVHKWSPSLRGQPNRRSVQDRWCQYRALHRRVCVHEAFGHFDFDGVS